MKKLITIAMTTAMALSASCAMAQENVKEELEKFVSQISENHISYSKSQTNSSNDFYGEYSFTLTKKERKNFETVKKAFYKDLSDAYSVFRKEAGDKTKKNILIGYGETLNENLRIGWPMNDSDDNILFLFFNDKDDESYRTVYGMVWREKGSKTEGKMYKIRSQNPMKSKKNKLFSSSPKVKVNKEKTLVQNVDGLKIVTGPNGTVVTGKDGKEIYSSSTITKTTPGGKIQSTISLGDETVTIMKDGKVIITDKNGDISPLTNGYSVTTNSYTTDPIQKFSNMRAAYLENLKEGNIDNTSILTGLANSILSFCKDNGSKMNEDERILCLKGLQEMQDSTPDDYIKGIFSLAVKAINKK